jgi:hypothetical protein
MLMTGNGMAGTYTLRAGAERELREREKHSTFNFERPREKPEGIPSMLGVEC